MGKEEAGEDEWGAVGLEAGGEVRRGAGSHWEVLSPGEAQEAVLEALTKAGNPNESAEGAMIPKSLIKLEGKNAAAMMRLNDALEEHEDVQNVYYNYDIDESEMENLS